MLLDKGYTPKEIAQQNKQGTPCDTTKNVKYKEISSKTVTSAFGENSLEKTEIAGVIGVSLIIIFEKPS